MVMTTRLIITLALVDLILITAVYLIKMRYQIIEKYMIQPQYERKFSIFEAQPIQNNDIVFLGDSLTDFFPLDEMFPQSPVKNRGISGDTTHGVLKRLRQVTEGQPRQIFLMIGTNDLGFGYSQEHILTNYNKILARIKQETPGTQVFVQSLLPRHKKFAGDIHAINREIERLAYSYDYPFIDLFPDFADAQGGLRSEFTNDKLHLLHAGYETWQAHIAASVYDESSSDRTQ